MLRSDRVLSFDRAIGQARDDAPLEYQDEDDHGHGYLDERTPEIAIAVWGPHRGRGIGTGLLDSLHTLAAQEGFERVSLSVHGKNPAVRVYRRAGYEQLADDDGTFRMVKNL